METVGPIVVPLGQGNQSLSCVGGKAHALARLVSAGLPVPDGFVVTTDAYRRFLTASRLQESIERIVNRTNFELPESITESSVEIQLMFDAATLPEDLRTRISAEYSPWGESLAVAVRSTATSEDLPELSFAGQHETVLGVRGTDRLLEAVRRCWASLWTARAMSYRQHMKIDHEQVAMAVVVQVMVEADASGIVFTANPLDGDRQVLVVNSTFGLGESIVGGEVTPDTFVVARGNLEIKRIVIGDKQETVTFGSGDYTASQPISDEKRQGASLTTGMIRQLAALAIEAEAIFDGVPQDIEWAISDEEIWLLQSRPITNLPAPPLDVVWEPPSKGAKLVRRQVVENMPDPLSALFDELYLHIGMERAIDGFMDRYGFAVAVDAFMDRPFFMTVNGYAYARGSLNLSWRSLWVTLKLICESVLVLPRLLRSIKTQWKDETLPRYLHLIEKRRTESPETLTYQRILEGMRELVVADAEYWFSVSIVVGAAKVTDDLLNRFLQSWFVPGNLTSGAFLRGFPSKTLEGQVNLESIAAKIRCDAELCELFREASDEKPCETLIEHPSADAVRADIEKHLKEYGRQVYNLDFAVPTLGENPAAIFVSLRELVTGRECDTVASQQRVIQERDDLIEKTSSSIGPVRRWLFLKLLGMAQKYGPSREEAMFYIGAAWSTFRRLASELGKRLVSEGRLYQPEDIYHLTYSELAEVNNFSSDVAHSACRLKDMAKQRRKLREQRMQLHAPPIIPEGTRWQIGPIDMTAWETQKHNSMEAEVLNGFAVSPGRVTGLASVVLTPADFASMKPGSILVCPTTTPAWTPLFGQSLALVTDIGGILAHGSIVAREYGIPAVLGTGNGTRRIVSGQRITVDGNNGTVEILD